MKELKSTQYHLITTESTAKVIPLYTPVCTAASYSSKLCINLLEKSTIIPIKNIKRLESDSNYTVIHTNDGKKVVVSKTMKIFMNLLPKEHFIKCHKSHIVNVDCITSITKTSLLLDSNVEIPISRLKHKELIERIKDNYISI